MAISMNVPDERWFGNGSGASCGEKETNGFDLVYHGTLAKRLGVDLTIRAVSNLSGRIPGLKFHVIGSGDDRDELVALAESLGLSSCIEFHGSIPIDRIASTLRSMNLGVISNRRNIATELMLPVKMLEYIALDIPVVAPPLKTIKHYFSDEMLSYFETEDVNSLSSAILNAYQSEEKRRDQVKNARRFLDQYGWERQKLDFINLYRSMAHPSRALNGQAAAESRKEIASC
jgi:glycosyltransferase involved in cell wall biosynthesis